MGLTSPRADRKLSRSLGGFHRKRSQPRAWRYTIQPFIDCGVEEPAAAHGTASFRNGNLTIVQIQSRQDTGDEFRE
jgi:hypothetical protein